jgi:hypothetical protein
MSTQKGTSIEDEDVVQITCKAIKCFRNMEGNCLLADIVKGEGKITLDEQARCEDYCE